MFQSKCLIGLDIGTYAIKFLELSRIKQDYQIEQYGILHLPPGIIVNDVIKNNFVMSSKLKEITQSNLSHTNVAIAISDNSVMTKTIQVDVMLGEREIENQLYSEIHQHIPYPLEEINIDYQLKEIDKKNLEKRNVLLVASHKNKVREYTEAIKAAGLNVQTVDVKSFAIERASAHLFKSFSEKKEKQCIAIIDLGGTTLTFTILNEEKIIFTRCENYLNAQLPFIFFREKETQIFLKEELSTSFKESLLLQIRRIIQMFSNNHQQCEINRVLLCGGLSLIPNLSEWIQEQLEIQTLLASPFSNIRFSESIDCDALMKISSLFYLSFGLSLREYN